MNYNIIEIRPRTIFEIIEERFPNDSNKFTVSIPSSQIGGLFLLESAILVSLVRLLDAENIFEFGTYMGATSVLLAENSKETARVTTIDLNPCQFEISDISNANLRDANENDEFLRHQYATQGPKYIKQENQSITSKIHQINEDSRNLDLAQNRLFGLFDLVFVDGGHDMETIENDTVKALKMVKQDAVIAWHDFRSTIHTEVTDFLNQFSREKQLVYVQSTMLALLPLGRSRDWFKFDKT